MKRLLILAMVLVPGLAKAQKSETRSVESFRGVKTQQAIDVYLKKGTKESVRVEANNVDLDQVYTEVSGDNLKVYLKSGSYSNVNVKVYVTYVELNRLSATSAANIFAENVIKAEKLSITAMSSGSVDIQVDAEELEANAGSAGDIILKGKADRVKLSAASAGDVDAYEVTCNSAEAQAVSAGSVKVSVVKAIEARAASGGSVRYRGNPERSNTSSTSGGSVKKSS
jgi:hypothetical protein